MGFGYESLGLSKKNLKHATSKLLSAYQGKGGRSRGLPPDAVYQIFLIIDLARCGKRLASHQRAGSTNTNCAKSGGAKCLFDERWFHPRFHPRFHQGRCGGQTAFPRQRSSSRHLETFDGICLLNRFPNRVPNPMPNPMPNRMSIPYRVQRRRHHWW